MTPDPCHAHPRCDACEPHAGSVVENVLQAIRMAHRATASVVIAGRALMQNLRRGHHELATETPRALRAAAAFTAVCRFR
jgi:hypothetical protein